MKARAGKGDLGLEEKGGRGARMPAEDQKAPTIIHNRAERAQRESQGSKRHSGGRRPLIFVVAEAQDRDVGSSRHASGFPEERPALRARLEKGGSLSGAQERQDEPWRAIPGSDVQEEPALDPRKTGKDLGHEPFDPGFRARRAREVDARAPGGKEVQVRPEGGRRTFGETKVPEGGAVNPRHLASSSSGAMVTRRPAPSPTL